MNHEFCPSFLKDPLTELESIATQSVFVGNHNFCDFALIHSFQKGCKTAAVEIEPTADVPDNVVKGDFRARFLEVGNLSVEIGRLVAGGDSRVDEGLSLPVGVGLFSVLLVEEGIDVGYVV